MNPQIARWKERRLYDWRISRFLIGFFGLNLGIAGLVLRRPDLAFREFSWHY